MTIDEDLQQQFAGLGVKVEKSKEETDVVEVWDTNWAAMTAFLAAATQWRIISRGMTGVLAYLGLDYSAVIATLDRLGLDAELADIQDIEAGALAGFTEAAEADA